MKTKRYRLLFPAITLGIAFFLLASPPLGFAETSAGLVIAAHGSPSPAWSARAAGLDEDVTQIIERKGAPFTAIKTAFLEFNQPSLAEAVRDMHDRGCDQIVVMPLFIGRSGHVLCDIPAVLGLYSTPDMTETLREENAEIILPSVPVTIGPTLSESDLLALSILDRVREISTDPENEALVLFAHGCEQMPAHWENLMNRITHFVCGKTGISTAYSGFIEVGQSYEAEGLPLIRQAADEKERVLVVGSYIALSPKKIHQRWTARHEEESAEILDRMGMTELLETNRIVFSERSFLPDTRLAEWIVDRATEIVEGLEKSVTAGKP